MVMDSEAHQKVTTAHLLRLAYLYVRQSTLRQVFENTDAATCAKLLWSKQDPGGSDSTSHTGRQIDHPRCRGPSR